jgi:predicted AlkP superfamily pyrophosphatase or phosphodiesterase
VGVKLVKNARRLLLGGHKRILDRAEVLYQPGEPYYYTQHACDVFENGLIEDDVVGERALALLEQYRGTPFFFFIHFAEVDHSGHRHGENSAEYEAALKSGDRWLGKIEDKLAALGLTDSTLILVTADHGFDEGLKAHKDAPFVFLGTNDPDIARNGMRQDITPTILDRLGVDLEGIFPPLDGVALGD